MTWMTWMTWMIMNYRGSDQGLSGILCVGHSMRRHDAPQIQDAP